MSTIEELLNQLDLGKYVEKFAKEEIDLDAAKTLQDADLAALGLPMGPRKKLYAALHEEAHSAPSAAAAAASAPAKPAAPAAKHHGKPAAHPPAAAGAKGKPGAKAAAHPHGQEKTKKFVWRWQRGGNKWPDYHGSGSQTFVLEPVPHPERLITFVRNCTPACESAVVKIWDIQSGRSTVDIRLKGYPCDSDILDGVIACCPSDRDEPVQFYDMAGQKKGSYESPGEGTCFLMSLYHNGSGALQVFATQSNCGGDIRLFDVATGSRAGKIPGILETYLNRVIRDPGQSSFVWVGENSCKVHGMDMRTNKQARQLMPEDGLQFAMSDQLAVFASSNKAIVMDMHNTGRVVKTIPSPVPNSLVCAAIYGNVLLLSCQGQYFFYDLDTAATEPAYDLKGEFAQYAALTKENVFLFSTSFVSMEHVA